MIGRLQDIGIAVPFGLNAASDNHNPSEVIADISARGSDFRTAITTSRPRSASSRHGRSTWSM